MRCHETDEMHIDFPALARLANARLCPLPPALVLPPCTSPFALGRHHALAQGVWFDVRCLLGFLGLHPEPPLVLLRLSALPTTLFLAEPRTMAPLLSPALIATATPARRPAWGPSLSATLSLDLIVWTVRKSYCPTDVGPCIA